jgi:hypothetical protein
MMAICVSEFGGPEVLKLEDMPDPRLPQSREVLVSVNAAGVNPYDTYMRSGAYGSKAKDFAAAGVPIEAIYAATLALARAGLLDDRERTSNALEYLTTSEVIRVVNHWPKVTRPIHG